jgi:hypothetical protein
MPIETQAASITAGLARVQLSTIEKLNAPTPVTRYLTQCCASCLKHKKCFARQTLQSSLTLGFWRLDSE